MSRFRTCNGHGGADMATPEACLKRLSALEESIGAAEPNIADSDQESAGRELVVVRYHLRRSGLGRPFQESWNSGYGARNLGQPGKPPIRPTRRRPAREQRSRFHATDRLGNERPHRCPGFIPGRAAHRDPGKKNLPDTPEAASIRHRRQRRVAWPDQWWSSAWAAPSRHRRHGRPAPRCRWR